MLPLSGLIITWPLTETQIQVKCYLEMEKQLVLFCVLSTFTSCFEGVSQRVPFGPKFEFLIRSYLAILTYSTLVKAEYEFNTNDFEDQTSCARVVRIK